MLLSPHRHLRVLRAGTIALVVGVFVGGGGCADGTGPADDEATDTADAFSAAVVVSDPEPLSFSAAAARSEAGAAASRASDEPVVYVSFPPGTVPGGEAARIRNRATGLSVEALVVDGGLDPVPLAANAGDTLDIVVVGAGAELASAIFIVPIRLPPVVIRTNPPKRKVDVPLNTVVLVVFSEPIQPASLVGGVALGHGATVVSGTVRLLPGGTAAEFLPDGLLAPETAYTLTINREIRDLQGDTLAVQVDVEFTTATSSATDLAINLPVDSPTVVVGAQLALRALDRATGSPVSSVAWSTSDPPVATIDTAGVLTVLGPGLVTIQATSGSVSASAVITAKTIQFDSIIAGNRHTCGLTAEGEAFCWGNNGHGQLGTDLPLASPYLATAPTRVAGGLRFRALAPGAWHTCGITTEAETYCWGGNGWGELGDGAIPTEQICEGIPCNPVPARVVGIPELRAVTAGGTGEGFLDPAESSCGLALNGTAYCWGSNYLGQLGNGSDDGYIAPGHIVHGTPEQVVASEPYQTIASDPLATRVCGLRASGQVQCWGAQEWDRHIGKTSGTPVAVPGTWTGLALGYASTCVRDPEGAIYCWGYNLTGTVADPPSDEFIAVPQPIDWSAGTPATSLALGVYSACGLTSDGEAWCWGSNDGGILGTSQALETCPARFGGYVIPCTSTPVRGGWGLRFLAFSMGGAHACGIASDGIAYCWGLNNYGEVGDGTVGGPPRGLTRVLGQP